MEKIIPPEHVALIPDGNRRWARSHSRVLLQSYKLGIEKFITFATWSKEFGVKTITVWALSTENLKGRTRFELRVLFDLYTRYAKDKVLYAMLKANGARVRVIGDIAHLPRKLQEALAELERKTADFHSMTINMLINYGGQEDIVYSINRLKASGVKHIDRELIKRNLRSAALPEVDLIVRTSGEQRLSGLLPWQTAYSELYFAKKYWPDFRKADFKKAILEFSRRQRRFGK